MRKIRFIVLSVFAIAFFLFPCICYSRVITVEYTAEVTEVYNVTNVLGGEINVGDTITGTYSYDTTGYTLENYYKYTFTSPLAGISAQINNFEFKPDPNNTDLFIYVENNTSDHMTPLFDELTIWNRHNLAFYNNEQNSEISSCGIEINLFAPFLFVDSYGPILKSLPALINWELPVNAIDLSNWYDKKISIGGYKKSEQTTETFSIEGILTSATLVSETPKIIYVDDNSTGLNNGSSWENAYTFLQDAIADANNSDKLVEIRVAQGTYKPDMGEGIIPGDREATFNLMSQVAIIGSFAGLSEPNPDVQNTKLYKTILTGDLNGDDLPGFANRSDNSYHVLSAIDVDESAYIEGLYITGGNADGLPVNNSVPTQRRDDHTIRGGGLYADNGHFYMIRNCTFKDNYAYGYGSGIYLSGSARFLNCNFSGNKAGISGGAVCFGNDINVLGDMYFRGCIFQGNSSVSGAESYTGPIAFCNCTLVDNFIEQSYSNIINCIIWNREQNLPPYWYSLYYSDININDSYLGDHHNINLDPLFADPGNWDDNGTPDDANDDFWVEGDYHLKSQAGRWNPNTQSWIQDDVTSPCIDTGDPNSPIGYEPFPNGGYINMGAYGGTSEASKSYFGKPLCETIIAGDINGDCKVDQTDMDILMLHWLDDNN